MTDFDRDQLDQIYDLWGQHYMSGMHELSAIRTCPTSRNYLDYSGDDGWYEADYWTSSIDFPQSFITDPDSINEFLKAYDMLSSHWEKAKNFFLIKYGNDGVRFVEFIYNFKKAHSNPDEKIEWVSLKEFDHG